eukprot:6269867-Amphidinium_carterae.2
MEDLVKKDRWGVASEVFIGLHNGSLPPLLDFPVAVSARHATSANVSGDTVLAVAVEQLAAARHSGQSGSTHGKWTNFFYGAEKSEIGS